MPRPYSVDLRERVVRSVENGLSCRQTAKRFHVSVSFVIKLLQRWRGFETVEPLAFGGHKTSALSGHADRVRALVASEPEMTIDDLCRQLAENGVQVSRSAVGRFLLELGLTQKKDVSCCRARPTGRSRSAHRMANQASRVFAGKAGVYR